MTIAMDRAWGAGDADSEYWFHAQMGAMAGFAAKESADLRRLPALYGAVRSAFAKEVPHDTVNQADVLTSITSLVGGCRRTSRRSPPSSAPAPPSSRESRPGCSASIRLGSDRGQEQRAVRHAAGLRAGADDVASLARWASERLATRGRR